MLSTSCNVAYNGVSTLPVVAADNAANEEFEVIGMDQRNWLKKMVGDLTKASTAKQVIAGGLSGWSVFCYL